MSTLLIAFSPLLLAYLEIALIRALMRRPSVRVGAHGGTSAEVARDHLTQVLASVGVHTEASGEEGAAPIELICRDVRPLIGGRLIVHAHLPASDRPASSADVLMLADQVWRAQGARGLLVADRFSDQARSAARAAGLSIELLGWHSLAAVSAAGSRGRPPLADTTPPRPSRAG